MNNDSQEMNTKITQIKKLSDRDEQLSALNAEKERCEQLNFVKKMPIDYVDYDSNQGL